ncbi:MAG: hypothetical protein E6Q97_20050 [Desulfurellales bacterium]|nr:MAG: hypothetical protein E6Q97_20050 [Desulfurellales bacterium]
MRSKTGLDAASANALLAQATHALAALRGEFEVLAPGRQFPAAGLLRKLLREFDIRPSGVPRRARRRKGDDDGSE